MRRLPFVRGTNTDKTEKNFADARRRPCRPSPTVPPRPVPWLPMAMADLTRAVGTASRRARARASQPPPPAGDVGQRKQLRRLFARTPLAVGIAMQLPTPYGTEACVGRAVSYSLRSWAAQGRRRCCKKNAVCTPRRGASPRWRPDVHVYDVGRASMWRLCVRVLCLSCARLDAVPFGPWLSVWGYGKTNFRIV